MRRLVVALSAGIVLVLSGCTSTADAGRPVPTPVVVPEVCLDALVTAEEVFGYAADAAEASTADDLVGMAVALAGITRLSPVWQANRDDCRAAARR